MQWGHKNSSWNKRVKDSDFRFLDSNIHKENIWKLSYLLIGFPSAIFPSQFMNILMYEALRIIFIRNCLIYEDAIFMWGKMRIRRRQNENDGLSTWSWKENVRRGNKVVEFAELFREPVNTAIDRIFFCELNLMVSGPITESFVFLNL